MSEILAIALVRTAGFYLGLGLLFAVAFVTFGAGRVDPRARGASIGFRLAVLPGVAALWPLLAWRWLRGQEPPEERNPHRVRAAAEGRR